MNRNRLIEEKLKKNKQNKIQIGKPTNYRTINFSLKFPNHKKTPCLTKQAEKKVPDIINSI